ncbi:winged helix-turn-helix domain-containing protein [Clostridium butyricum]|nr:winged helix-turn-helix domain-containing protein [Clostridium butyricum]
MTTKYEIVINKLMNNIKDGVYDKDKKLPTEDELMNIFSVSRNTIRKAIEILVNHGYVYQVQGSGIFL